MTKNKIFIIDVMPMMYRAYFGMIKSPVKTSFGFNTSSIYGFLKILFNIIEKKNPKYIVAAIDSYEPSFRKVEFSTYKSNRKCQPEDISKSIPFIEKILEEMKIKIIKYPGYEADDIIGTIVKKLKDQDIDIYIVSPDKDFGQLLFSENIFIYKSGNFHLQDEIISKDDILKNWNIETVDQITDIFGLVGDLSDNIPGIPSIGPKTACKLLEKYKTLENIIQNSFELNDKVKKKIEEFANQGLISKKLATIFCDLSLDINLEDFKYENQNNFSDDLEKIFEYLEFKSLMKKTEIKKNKNEEFNLTNIQTNFSSFKDNLEKIQEVFYFQEKDQVYFLLEDKIYCFEKNFISEQLFENKIFICYFFEKNNFISKDININFEVVNLENLTFILHNVFLKNINDYFKFYKFDFESIEKSNIVLIFSQIYQKIKEEIKNQNLELYFEKVECFISKVIFSIENNGVFIDRKKLEEISDNFQCILEELEREIYKIADEKFNIASAKQLGNILFEKLKISEKVKKTKTGQYKTDEETLSIFIDKHSIIKKILDLKEIMKIKNTYIDGIRNFIDENSLIYTTYSQISSTGRILSRNPNLQTIPIKTSLGKKVRSIFSSRFLDDGLIISADYSQIELRIIAFLSKEEEMLRAFYEKKDIHIQTACKIFSLSEDQIDEDKRRKAKAVNFGIIYGISSFGLAKNLKISKKEAQEIIDSYFEKFSNLNLYIENQIKSAKDLGYCKTMMNRKHYLSDINSNNSFISGSSQRNAINFPIQGSAAEIIKIAMIEVDNFLKKNSLKSKMIMQIHDELVFDVFKSEATFLSENLKKIMENLPFIDKIPLEINISCGKNWMEC
jgi:DNA polymerase-1